MRNPGWFQSMKSAALAYYGNWAMFKPSFWRTDYYKNLSKYLVDARGIYQYRWDDQHLYPMAMAMFSGPEKVLQMFKLKTHVSHKPCNDPKWKLVVGNTSVTCARTV